MPKNHKLGREGSNLGWSVANRALYHWAKRLTDYRNYCIVVCVCVCVCVCLLEFCLFVCLLFLVHVAAKMKTVLSLQSCLGTMQPAAKLKLPLPSGRFLAVNNVHSVATKCCSSKSRIVTTIANGNVVTGPAIQEGWHSVLPSFPRTDPYSWVPVRREYLAIKGGRGEREREREGTKTPLSRPVLMSLQFLDVNRKALLNIGVLVTNAFLDIRCKPGKCH